MTGPEIQGWCPGAWKPMQSGDGWIYRIRPWFGRLSADQLAGIADLSRLYGNGHINLTARANIQLRGVDAANQDALLSGLQDLGLLDSDGDREGRRNIITSPFWKDGDGVHDLAKSLTLALQDDALAGLPGKFGFVIEAPGLARMLDISADIRLYVQDDCTCLLALDGQERGMRIALEETTGMAARLAEWFLTSGGVVNGRGRMKRFLAGAPALPDFFRPDQPLPELSELPIQPGHYAPGFMAAFPYGRAMADDFSWLANQGQHFRMTPWHMLLAEDRDALPDHGIVITKSGDNRLHMAVCTGAPACWQGKGDTLALADNLASLLPEQMFLHISGCAKGCANRPAVTDHIIATEAGYDFVPGPDITAAPTIRGLDTAALAAMLKQDQPV